MIVPFSWLIATGKPIAALWLFIIISAFDGVDGFVARHMRQSSRFGEILDGASDVIILIIAFLLLGGYGYIPQTWHTLLIIIPLALLFSKLTHFKITRKTEHTLIGKINAIFAYATIISALAFPSIHPFILAIFLVTSAITAIAFFLDIRKSKLN
jgi:cardiolipin synthase